MPNEINITEEIKQRLDLRDYIPIDKKIGQWSFALCPFHSDTKPSLLVQPEHYYCFSCLRGGDIFSWLEFETQKSFIEILEQLAKDAGIPFKQGKEREEYQKQHQEGQWLVDGNKRLSQRYEAALWEDPGFPLEYLYNRGLDKETIEKFHLGYDEQQSAITIPAWNLHGDIVVFTYRFLGSDLRYLTKNNILFRRGQSLFYLPDIQLAGRDRPVYVVEGQIDAISLTQIGNNAIATFGMSVSDDQVKLLYKISGGRPIIFVPDCGGLRWAESIAERIRVINNDAIIEAVLLEAGDANEALQAGTLQKQVGQAVPFDVARLRDVISGNIVNIQSQYYKGRAIFNETNPIIGELLIQEASSKWKVPEAAVREFFKGDGLQMKQAQADSICLAAVESAIKDLQQYIIGYNLVGRIYSACSELISQYSDDEITAQDLLKQLTETPIAFAKLQAKLLEIINVAKPPLAGKYLMKDLVGLLNIQEDTE